MNNIPNGKRASCRLLRHCVEYRHIAGSMGAVGFLTKDDGACVFFGKLTIFVAGRVVYDSKALLILPDKPFIFTSMNYSFLDFLGLLGLSGFSSMA